MDKPEHSQDIKNLGNHKDEISKYRLVILDRSIKSLMLDIVNSLTIMELTLHREHQGAKAFSANLIR